MYQEHTRYEGTSAQDIPMYALGMMPYGALAGVIADNGLTMDMGDLEHCRRYFFSVLRRAPSLNELKMLDEIIKIRNSRLSSYRITQIVSENKKVSETYGDLFAKAKYLRRKTQLPLSLGSLAGIAPEYLRSIGCDALDGEDRGSEEKSFNMPLQPEISLILLLPSNEMDNGEYAERVRSLYSDVRLYGRLGPLKTVNEFGLLSTLSDFSIGIFGDAAQLPKVNGESDISALTGRYCGRVIVSAFGYLADTVKAVAAELGLCAYYFGKTTNTGKMFFRRYAAPELFIDVRFIKELTEAKANASVNIPAESLGTNMLSLGEPIDMMSAYGTDTIMLSAELLDDPFDTSVMLPAYILLCAMTKGYRRRDIGIKTEYLFSSRADGDMLALSVSSILGVYRSLIELCVSSDSDVKYGVGAPTVKCAAICKGRRRSKSIPQLLTAEGSRLYLLDVSFTPDGLPDFASLRAACKQIEALVKANKILSARALCGDIGEALDAMRSEFAADVNNELSAGENMLGIIFESRDELPMRQIGTTVRT